MADDSIEFDVLNTITLSDYSNVTGKKLVSFKFDGESYRQNRYLLMLLEMIRVLDNKHKGILENLAASDFSFYPKYKHKHISHSPNDMRWALETRENSGIYIEGNLSARDIMRFIDSLLEQFGENKESFSIQVIAEETEEDNAEDVDGENSSF